MNHFFLTLGISVATLLSWLALPSSAPAQETANSSTAEQATPASSSSKTDLTPEELIDQLSAPNFVDRQSAAQALVELGDKAKPALTTALESNDLNIREQAKILLDRIRPAANSVLGEADRATFDRIMQMPAKSQLTQFGQLLTRDKIPLIIQLSENLDSMRSYLYEGEGARLNTILLYSIVNGNWEQAERLINHPFTRSDAPAISYYYHQVMGTFDQFLEDERRFVLQTSKTFPEETDKPAALKKPAPQKAANPAPADWVRGDFTPLKTSPPATEKNRWKKRGKALVAHYRGQGDLKAAKEIANVLPKVTRNELLSQIMLESGDWKLVLANSVDTSEKMEGDGRIAVNAAQKAFLQKLADDQAGLKESIETLKKQLNEAVSAEDEIAANAARGQLKSIGLTTLNWELVEANTPDAEREDLFDFASSLMRNRDALALMKIPAESTKRIAKFETRLKEVSELEKLYREQLKKKDKAYRTTQLKIKKTRDRLINVADHLGSLGFVDEMDLYLQQLLTDNLKNSATQNQIIGILRQHGRHEAIWKVLKANLSNSQTSTIGHYLFRNRITYASSILNLIKGYEQDPQRQIEIMACLSNDPLGFPKDLDFDFELARLRSASTISSIGYAENYLSSLSMVNGRYDESNFYLNESRQMGNVAAIRQHAHLELDAQRYESVTEYYDERWRVTRAAIDAVLAAHALQQLLTETTDPKQRNELTQRWREAKMVAFVSWSSRSYAVTSASAQLSSLDLLELAEPLLKTDVYGANGNLIRNNRFQQYLIDAFADPKSTQHRRGAIEAAIRIYNDLGIDSVTSRSERSWYQMMETLTLALAYAEIAEGDHDRALQRLLACNQFRPMNSSLGQYSVPMFDQQGKSEHGDRLFEAIAEPFGRLFHDYPDAAMYRNNYAWLCATTKRRLESAKRHVNLALKQQPDNATFLDTLAEVEFLLGNRERAIELNQRCRHLQPLNRSYRQQAEKFKNK